MIRRYFKLVNPITFLIFSFNGTLSSVQFNPHLDLVTNDSKNHYTINFVHNTIMFAAIVSFILGQFFTIMTND